MIKCSWEITQTMYDIVSWKASRHKSLRSAPSESSPLITLHFCKWRWMFSLRERVIRGSSGRGRFQSHPLLPVRASARVCIQVVVVLSYSETWRGCCLKGFKFVRPRDRVQPKGKKYKPYSGVNKTSWFTKRPGVSSAARSSTQEEPQRDTQSPSMWSQWYKPRRDRSPLKHVQQLLGRMWYLRGINERYVCCFSFSLPQWPVVDRCAI